MALGVHFFFFLVSALIVFGGSSTHPNATFFGCVCVSLLSRNVMSEISIYLCLSFCMCINNVYKNVITKCQVQNTIGTLYWILTVKFKIKRTWAERKLPLFNIPTVTFSAAQEPLFYESKHTHTRVHLRISVSTTLTLKMTMTDEPHTLRGWKWDSFWWKLLQQTTTKLQLT